MAKRAHEASLSRSDTDTDTEPYQEAGSPRPPKANAVEMSGETQSPSVIQCSLPPHRDVLSFASAEEFEVHYAKEHSSRCSQCGKNFPTAHFLTLHIDENHNAFREALQAKGEKTYACFVEGCEKLCSTPQKRRLHLIDKHLFPKIYNFRLVDTGIDKSTSMLHEGRRRRVSTTDHNQSRGGLRRVSKVADLPSEPLQSRSRSRPTVDNPDQTAETQPQDPISSETKSSAEDAMGQLEQSMSALRFVPPSVTNNQRRKRG